MVDIERRGSDDQRRRAVEVDEPDDRLDGPLLTLIVVMFVGGALALLDATIVNVSIDTLGRSLHSPLATIEWVSTGYLLAAAVAIPVTGWAVDRYGGRLVWLLGLGLFTAGSALAAVAWSAGSLIAFRVVQGVGGGMLEPTRLTVLARAAGPRRAGRVIGLISISSTVGPVLGPVIGGVILDDLSWRWMFLVNIPVGVVAIALALWAMPRSAAPAGTARKIDPVGIGLLSASFTALIYALSRAADAGFGATQVLVGLLVGLALAGSYAAHATRRPDEAVVDLRLFRGGGFAASVGIMFVTGGALFSLMFIMPLYWQQARGHSVLDAGLLLAPLGVGTLIGMPLAGEVADRVGARRLVPPGAALVGLGTLAFALSGTRTSIVALAGASVLAGIGLGFVAAPTMSSIYRTVPVASAGSATGAIVIGRQLGASAGVAVVTVIVATRRSHGISPIAAYTSSFWWAIGGAVAVMIAGLVLPGRPHRPTPAPEPGQIAEGPAPRAPSRG
jgi:EmrB/QacA subfamily drug resistance transporter